MNEQENFNDAVIKALANQKVTNEATDVRFTLVMEALENQKRLNEINQATIHRHGKSIENLLISNASLIAALVALVLKLAMR